MAEAAGRIFEAIYVRKALLLVVVLSLGFTCILVACSGDRRESFYPSLADADKDGAITRGWIPDFLPGSSRTIHEVHEISPSTEWCAFEFLPTDSQGLRKALTSADATGPRVRRVRNPGVLWWPAVLNGNLDVEKIHKAGFELYVVERPETSVTTSVLLFAIDWQEGHGFFYLRPE
ncbi:MAG TPA: hypothetical protein VMV59_12530 [Candidatus Dormibacteraeota bacterium]|nr:hypothetical protein [Candidatus Dormibacteraeota bacterium]